MNLFKAVTLLATNIICDEVNCYFITFMKKQAITQCYQELQISKEDVINVLNHKHVPDDYIIKCWLSCVLKKLGVMRLIRMDWGRYKHIIKHCIDNEDGKAKVDKLIKLCQAQVFQEEKDECQLAYSVKLCEINNWKKLGLPIRDWEE